MEKIEYREVMDKSEWARGPWDDEPDKIQWQDEETGLPCLIVRNWMGALCGYVGVAPGHPFYEKGYDNLPINVHGGLTYARGCMEGVLEKEAICHIPAKGEPDHAWWFGFDCAHYNDYCPERPMESNSYGKFCYRDVGYVQDQCRILAKQLKAITE